MENTEKWDNSGCYKDCREVNDLGFLNIISIITLLKKKLGNIDFRISSSTTI